MGDHQTHRRPGLTATTIAAAATAPGEGAVGIVRLSGPKALDIGATVAGLTPRKRHAHFATFRDADGSVIDQGLVIYFPAPASFTGEDVIELQGHGGPVVMQMLLERVTGLGASLARPGEFSERAFLNGKLDLAQAEAIADLIASHSATAARAAMRSLEGAFSDRVNALLEELVALRVYIEAAIDFPDEEDVDFLGSGEVEERLEAALARCRDLLDKATRGRVLRAGLHVALTGRPNAGKSSLLNALAETDTAIVTPIPGTTRDVLREHIELNGVPVHLVDTAGIREASDVVEAEGVRRALREVELADVVLHLVDAGASQNEDLPADDRVIVVRNKIDLVGAPPGEDHWQGQPRLNISVATGAGLDLLRATLIRRAGLSDAAEAPFTARARHIRALRRCAGHLESAHEQLVESQAGELVAEELRLAQDALGEVTGRFGADDLLGEIFSSFCIGK